MRLALLGLVLVACASKEKEAPEVVTPSAPVAAAAPAATPSGKQKRTRTRAAAPPERDGTKPKNGRALNPRDPVGRKRVLADPHTGEALTHITPA